jgi:hypothetical protein
MALPPAKMPPARDWADAEEPETKTLCPACQGSKVRKCVVCRGCGKSELVPVEGDGNLRNRGVYRWVLCEPCKGNGCFTCGVCKGQGMVSISHASDWRRQHPNVAWNVVLPTRDD